MRTKNATHLRIKPQISLLQLKPTNDVAIPDCFFLSIIKFVFLVCKNVLPFRPPQIGYAFSPLRTIL